jgi:hypothetical protein
MRVVAPPAVDTEQEHDGGDPNPCSEDEEFFKGLDADGMEEAISKFLDGLEGQERSGFKGMHSFLAKLPVPVTTETRSMTHAAALEGGFLPEMDEEELKRFTPTELILYKHAQEYRYMIAYTRSYRFILVCTCIYLYIPFFSQMDGIRAEKGHRNAS